MGIFSQDSTKTNQTAYNNQVGVSNTAPVGGAVTTGASGAVTAGGGGVALSNTNLSGGLTINSLDATALSAAADTINHAIDSNKNTAQGALQGFQNALGVVSENQQASAAIATGQANSFLGQLGIQPNTLIWIAVAAVGGLIIYAVIKHKKLI